MKALQNIRVVDFTHVIAGPFCTYQLAVMGADVIKIEAPDSPDMVRAKTTDFPAGENGLAPFFVGQNANKRAIAVDIKSAPGKKIIRRLIKSADVLVENYRCGALAKQQFGYADVKQIKPDIIYCSLTGFGQAGPKAGHTAYDNVIQAFSGLMAANGDAVTAPVKVGPPILDFGTGIQAAFAIVAALYQRTHTGEGQYIDIAMLDAALMLMSSNLCHYREHGEIPPLSGNMSSGNAGYSCYQTRQGELMLGAYTGAQTADMWAVLGEPEYGEQFRHCRPPAFAATQEADSEKIARILQRHSADHWEAAFNANRVPAAKVRQLDETLQHEQLQHRRVVQTPCSTSADSPAYPTAAFHYAHDGPALQTPPPVFAQHSREVLQELDYGDAEVEQLIASGVVAAA